MRGIRSIFASPTRRVAHGKSWIRRIGIAGFTLLELFIVIEIIGLLATIVMSNYYKSKKAAEVAVVVQNIKNVQIALTSYFAMESRFPATLNPIWLQFYNGRVVDDFDYCTVDGGAGGIQRMLWPADRAAIRRMVGLPFGKIVQVNHDTVIARGRNLGHLRAHTQ